MLYWFADLMNVTEEVTIHRPNVSTLLSNALIRGDLNAATRGPFFRTLIYFICEKSMVKLLLQGSTGSRTSESAFFEL